MEDATSKLSPSHQGILFAHAYGLEKLAEVAGRRLLRLRNPWGRGEWSGAWGDESAEWTSELLLQVQTEQACTQRITTPLPPSLPPSLPLSLPYSLLTCSTALYCLLCTQLEYEFADDGTFWMELTDFMRMFNTVYTARLFGPTTLVSVNGGGGNGGGGGGDGGVEWCRQYIQGKWTDTNSGGSPKHSTWRNNPCVLVTVEKDMCAYVLLSQPDPRSGGSVDGTNMIPAIGFVLTRRDAIPLLTAAAHESSSNGSGKSFSKLPSKSIVIKGLPLRSERDIGSSGGEHMISAGQYLLIPFTGKSSHQPAQLCKHAAPPSLTSPLAPSLLYPTLQAIPVLYPPSQ